jgi:hypothetical protein
LFGCPVADKEIEELTPLYCQQVILHAGKRAKQAYFAIMPVMMPAKDRVFYELAYITFHPVGLIEFKRVLEEQLNQQHTVQAKAKLQKRELLSGQNDLFGSAIDGVRSAVLVDTSDALPGLLLKRIFDSGGAMAVSTAVFADLLCEFNCLPQELQFAIGHLIAEGKLVNQAIKFKRRSKFVHYEKSEVLKLVRTEA